METLLATPGSFKLPTKPKPEDYNLNKAMYDLTEVADVTSIGRSSLWKIIKRGELHPVKYGQKTFIFADELARFLSTIRGAA